MYHYYIAHTFENKMEIYILSIPNVRGHCLSLESTREMKRVIKHLQPIYLHKSIHRKKKFVLFFFFFFYEKENIQKMYIQCLV